MKKRNFILLLVVILLLVLVTVVYSQIKTPQLQTPQLIETDLPTMISSEQEFKLDIKEVESFWVKVIPGEENRLSIVGPLGLEADEEKKSDLIGPLGIEPGDLFINPDDYFIIIEGMPGESMTIEFSYDFEEVFTSILLQPHDPWNLDIQTKSIDKNMIFNVNEFLPLSPKK